MPGLRVAVDFSVGHKQRRSLCNVFGLSEKSWTLAGKRCNVFHISLGVLCAEPFQLCPETNRLYYVSLSPGRHQECGSAISH
jgi:hypothetical protein